jgi:hypothetical protein
MIKSAFQIPHHVAIRSIVYAPLRCFGAENLGAGGADFPHSVETLETVFEVFRSLAPKLSRIRGLYGQTV